MTMVLMNAIAGGGAAARTSTLRTSMLSGGGSMGNVMTAKVGSGRSNEIDDGADLTVATPTSVLTGLSSHGLGEPDSGSLGCCDPQGFAHRPLSSRPHPPNSRWEPPLESRQSTMSPPATAWKPVVSRQMTAIRRWRTLRFTEWKRIGEVALTC